MLRQLLDPLSSKIRGKVLALQTNESYSVLDTAHLHNHREAADLIAQCANLTVYVRCRSHFAIFRRQMKASPSL
jgi:hypothetical protein